MPLRNNFKFGISLPMQLIKLLIAIFSNYFYINGKVYLSFCVCVYVSLAYVNIVGHDVCMCILYKYFAFILLCSSFWINRSSRPEVLLEKGVLIICGKFAGGHPCRSVISRKLLCNFIRLRQGCSPVNLLHFFWTSFPKNTSGGLLLNRLLVEERVC